MKQKKIKKRTLKKYKVQVLDPLSYAYSSHYQEIITNKENQKIYDYIYFLYLEKLDEFAHMMDTYLKTKH